MPGVVPKAAVSPRIRFPDPQLYAVQRHVDSRFCLALGGIVLQFSVHLGGHALGHGFGHVQRDAVRLLVDQALGLFGGAVPHQLPVCVFVGCSLGIFPGLFHQRRGGVGLRYFGRDVLSRLAHQALYLFGRAVLQQLIVRVFFGRICRCFGFFGGLFPGRFNILCVLGHGFGGLFHLGFNAFLVFTYFRHAGRHGAQLLFYALGGALVRVFFFQLSGFRRGLQVGIMAWSQAFLDVVGHTGHAAHRDFVPSLGHRVYVPLVTGVGGVGQANQLLGQFICQRLGAVFVFHLQHRAGLIPGQQGSVRIITHHPYPGNGLHVPAIRRTAYGRQYVAGARKRHQQQLARRGYAPVAAVGRGDLFQHLPHGPAHRHAYLVIVPGANLGARVDLHANPLRDLGHAGRFLLRPVVRGHVAQVVLLGHQHGVVAGQLQVAPVLFAGVDPVGALGYVICPGIVQHQPVLHHHLGLLRDRLALVDLQRQHGGGGVAHLGRVLQQVPLDLTAYNILCGIRFPVYCHQQFADVVRVVSGGFPAFRPFLHGFTSTYRQSPSCSQMQKGPHRSYSSISGASMPW